MKNCTTEQNNIVCNYLKYVWKNLFRIKLDNFIKLENRYFLIDTEISLNKHRIIKWSEFLW